MKSSKSNNNSFEDKAVSFRINNQTINDKVFNSENFQEEIEEEKKKLSIISYEEDKSKLSGRTSKKSDKDSKIEKGSKKSVMRSQPHKQSYKLQQPSPKIVVEQSNTINTKEDDGKRSIITSYYSGRKSVSQMHRSVNERVFWTKDQIQNLWERLKIASEKIKNKIVTDFQNIYNAVRDGDEEYVIERLHNEEFKGFYRIELSKNKLLEYMLMQNQPKILLRVLEDNFYSFNKLFVFEFLRKLLSLDSREVKNPPSMREIKGLELEDHEEMNIDGIHDEQLNEIMLNIVQYGFYCLNPQLIILFSWFLANFENYDAFRLLTSKHKDIFNSDMDEFNKFENSEDINRYAMSKEKYSQALSVCLQKKLEDLAISLIDYQHEMKEISIIDVAIETKSMNFLKFIWEQTHRVSEDFRRSSNLNPSVSKKRKSLANQSIKSSQHIHNFNGGIQVFTISEIIVKFKDKGYMSFINKMITEWGNLHQDEELLNTLFNQHCFNQISFIIWRMPSFWTFTEAHFKKVIEYEQLELILHFLQLRDCLTILNDVPIQKTVVDNYMLYGNKMYYGAEMLVYIYKANWDEKLTKNLCKNIIRTIKTKDILNCHSPILTCLLLCEFLKELGALSIQHKSRCETVVLELIQFCRNIQNANPDENYIRFLMTQKDTRHRSCFQIASENYFYQVLQTAEIGTIVKKMWNGNISNNGFFAASSMHRYLDSDVKKMDPFYSFEILDTKKKYFFQLAVWTDSCSMRYWPESLSTIFLIILYNLFIYFLVKNGQILNNFYELDDFLKFMLLFYIFWILSIILNIFMAVTFSVRTKRKFKFDVWTFYEFVTFIFAILLLVDTKKIFNHGSGDNAIQFINEIVKNLEIPFGKILNVQPSSYSGTWAFIIRACILAINDLLVWLRITGILLTFKEIGPTIRMIYMMGVLLIKYVLIIVLFMACCAAIFTAIFHIHSEQFKDFSTSVMSLFAGFVGSFDTNNFHEDYLMIGSSMMIVYVCVAGILLINLLIALLSNVYEKMSLVVDASHRSVLISYYRRYKWNKSYGYMIFLTTPLSIVNYLVLPISFCISIKSLEKFNLTVCKFYYTIFYFPFIFVIYIIYSLMVIPICFIKGIFKTIASQSMLKISRIIKTLNVIKWIGGGLFFLGYVYLRDIYFILATVYIDENLSESTETNRIRSYITPDEVVIFLKFIHKRKSDKLRDIHSLFMDYLEFEQRQKAKNDNILREKKHYLDNLHTAARRTSKKDGKTVVIYNNLKSNITSNYIKKNLIIIEILENFLIDQESDSLLVDLEKLKTLLPMTMNINNAYIKRLIHTDVHALNKAVNKLKLKKNVFLQYQLLNKIVSSAIRLDKLIDHEIMKNLRKKTNKKKSDKDSDKSSEHEEGNDIQYMQDLDNMLDNITDDIKDTIEMKKRVDRMGLKDGSVSPSRKMRSTLRQTSRDMNTVHTGKDENAMTINNSMLNKSKALSAEFNLISSNREVKEEEKFITKRDVKEVSGERDKILDSSKIHEEKNELLESPYNLLKITSNIDPVEYSKIIIENHLKEETKESTKFAINNYSPEVSSMLIDIVENQETQNNFDVNINNLLDIKNLPTSNTGKFFNSPNPNDLQIIYENIQKEDLNTINYEDSNFLEKKKFESINHEGDEKKDEEIIFKIKRNNQIHNSIHSRKSNLPLLDNDQIE